MEKQLYVLGILDDATQKICWGFHQELVSRGFIGTQTNDIPFHITLGAFSLDETERLLALFADLKNNQPSISMEVSYVGVFGMPRVLFFGPSLNPEFMALKKRIGCLHSYSPHITLLIDEKDIVDKAAEIVLTDFQEFMGSIVSLRLVEYSPEKILADIPLGI